MKLYHTGNLELLSLPKTAFLCSRKIPANIVLKCYDWAIEQRDNKNCIISGFHSQIEKDVFHYLLKGSQPIIIALARGLKDNFESEILTAVGKGRLLIISPFEVEIKRVTSKTAEIRNRLMIELADKIAVGFLNEFGTLSKLLKKGDKEINII
jgi:predicted Rossmann fold nucleotide-binding protein DprA/Smf involved in DNA uptake